MTVKVTIKTKRFLRKPKVEVFTFNLETEEEVFRVIAKFRPKSEILNMESAGKKQ